MPSSTEWKRPLEGGRLLRSFQDQLERIRRDRGMTRCAFAQAIGVARSSYFFLMSPYGNPGLDTVETIADRLGIEPWSLLPRPDNDEAGNMGTVTNAPGVHSTGR